MGLKNKFVASHEPTGKTIQILFFYLVCSEFNHVRTWSVTRFRGMINTQPGSMPLASFNIFNIEEPSPPLYYSNANDFGST